MINLDGKMIFCSEAATSKENKKSQIAEQKALKLIEEIKNHVIQLKNDKKQLQTIMISSIVINLVLLLLLMSQYFFKKKIKLKK